MYNVGKISRSGKRIFFILPRGLFQLSCKKILSNLMLIYLLPEQKTYHSITTQTWHEECCKNICMNLWRLKYFHLLVKGWTFKFMLAVVDALWGHRASKFRHWISVTLFTKHPHTGLWLLKQLLPLQYILLYNSYIKSSQYTNFCCTQNFTR